MSDGSTPQNASFDRTAGAQRWGESGQARYSYNLASVDANVADNAAVLVLDAYFVVSTGDFF